METESYEDDGLRLSPIAGDPSPPRRRNKLRRLRRASSPVFVDAHMAPVLDPEPDLPVGSALIEAESEAPGKEMSPDADDLDPLFSIPTQDDGDEEVQERDDGGDRFDGKKKSAKKRLSLDGDEGEETGRKKKRSKSRRSVGDGGGKHKESVREMRRLEKERRAHLELIHAESQRLLRETRNASFKPVPIVQKPISSVLERIRKRKLEVWRSSGGSSQSGCSADADAQMGEIARKSDPSEPQKDGRRENDEITNVHSDVHVTDEGRRSRSPPVLSGSIPDNKASDRENLKDNHQILSNGTEDVSNGSHQNNRNINRNTEDIPKDSMVSSLPASSLKHDSADDLHALPDGFAFSSSSEEESDKENADPHLHKMTKMNSYAEDSIVKDFLDDEAEVEDDSDHDMMRLEENDDGDESDENEVLKDLIATGYEEAPVDQEKRNELHQKWLEQQDLAQTENFLQRLQCGLPHEEEDGEEASEDSGDATLFERIPSETAQKNSKKVKQMIAQMFTDENDAYVPSDDEETEQALIRQRLLKQNEEEPSFISPMEDENSREVFGLIKKLNIAPDTKKKTKLSRTGLDMLLNGGNSTSSSKSSFLGRATSNSLPSSHKQGSSTMRAFIFGRDDSNSRSGISMSGNLTDNDQKENQCTKTASVKISSTQLRTTVSKTKLDTKTNSGSSLFEILRQSSIQYDKQLEKRNHSSLSETQAAFQFSAFKLGRKVSNVEARR